MRERKTDYEEVNEHHGAWVGLTRPTRSSRHKSCERVAELFSSHKLFLCAHRGELILLLIVHSLGTSNKQNQAEPSGVLYLFIFG